MLTHHPARRLVQPLKLTATHLPARQAITGENLARNDVIMIQQSLRQEGLYNGTADGVWGPRTASALMQFQQKNQLGATGQLNTNTLDQLGVELGASGSSKTSTSGSASGSTSGGY
jgi:peptidoglycan hydrolase-like protein with peptidoglycan-binding domain